MSAPAVVPGSLVNMRNVGTHKSVALTVHVPEELAQQVIAAFGWPTAASPVAVALARLNPNAKLDAQPEAGPKERRRFQDLPPAQQAALKCKEIAFQRFLHEQHESGAVNEPLAVDAVRDICGVASRSELNTAPDAAARWTRLLSEFDTWMQVPA